MSTLRQTTNAACASDPRTTERLKRTYGSPTLTSLGRVQDLTHGGNRSPSSDLGTSKKVAG